MSMSYKGGNQLKHNSNNPGLFQGSGRKNGEEIKYKKQEVFYYIIILKTLDYVEIKFSHPFPFK